MGALFVGPEGGALARGLLHFRGTDAHFYLPSRAVLHLGEPQVSLGFQQMPYMALFQQPFALH